MIKNVFIIFVLLIGAFSQEINAETLNSRTASNCLQQVDRFINDFESYYEIQIRVVGITGRIRDNNQINVEVKPDSMYITLLYNNEVMMTINIDKSTRRSDVDAIEFDYSQRFGFTTIYAKSYDRFEQLSIKLIFISLFESFGLL
jgi:hypothetical protein